MLKDYHRDLFRGFLGIGNLEEQIANAIDQAESKQDDRTSRTGNVLILGAHGCGKTTIATGIAKAIAEDKGTHSVKMARIYAADLNRKDIAATIAKIAGGVLIIEEAGDLEDGIVDPSGEGVWIADATPGPSEKENVHRPIR
jgi:DNA helicase TIP49 (TBP-interacting protein)